MRRTFKDLVEAMGGRAFARPEYSGRRAISQGGFIIHEVGGAMMGTDPSSSATDRWGQAWDVKNLFLADGATFCSNADKNPTLTIMAMAWRAADRIVEKMRRKDL
jgi:choline dehydrogenase-like flavoprotein